MENAVIIGKGNLGLDLKVELEKAGYKVHIFTRSEGFAWPKSRTEILALQPEVVFVTAGFGSVDQCKEDFMGALETHVNLPIELAKCLPKRTLLGLFSTDYAANESDPGNRFLHSQRPKSLYACSKLWMEKAMELSARPYTTVFRVGSLYGSWFPEKCFPAKLKARYPNPCKVSLPQNTVTPTPTWWIAEWIVRNLESAFDKLGPTTHHVAPVGGCTVLEWGHLILGDGYTFESRAFDNSRPSFSNLDCSLEPSPKWQFLWDSHQVRVRSEEGQQTSHP